MEPTEPTPKKDPYGMNADMDKWAVHMAKIIGIGLGALFGTVILATGAILIQGVLSMPQEQKINLVKQTVDALPAIGVSSVIAVGLIAAGTAFAIHRDNIREARRQGIPPDRRVK